VGLGLRVAGSLAAAAVAVSFVFPWLSTRYTARAFARYRVAPDAALADARRAARLDPLSADPVLTQGTIALQLGRWKTAQKAFERALDREDSWYAWLELALLDARSGHRAAAREKLRRVRALDAGDDDNLAGVAAALKKPGRLDPRNVDRMMLRGPLYRQERIS
jgi:tetratricopeptide (TPR) repeat protein